MRTPFTLGVITNASSKASLYQDKSFIGNGAYGTVYKAKDPKDPNRWVALKKIRISVSEDGIPVHILREISLVRQLDRFQHPNVVRFLDVCHGPRGSNGQSLTLCLVFEFVERDLAKYIWEAQADDLSPAKIKDIMFQLLCGVDFIHSQRIVHRDLKPQNVLMSRTGQVKLADFGLAKVYDFSTKLTDVVVTLWYRSPEVLLACTYATPVDMWSLGCIFAELVKRRALFPGDSERDQLEKIFDVIGTPTHKPWPQEFKILPVNFSPRLGRNFEVVFQELDAKGINLLQRLIKFSPEDRINAHNALLHPYFDERAVPVVALPGMSPLVPKIYEIGLPLQNTFPFPAVSVPDTFDAYSVSITSTPSSPKLPISGAEDSRCNTMLMPQRRKEYISVAL